MLDVFITGSESRLGKRLVTAGLAATMQSLGYSTGVYMPVQTGAVERNGYIEAPDLIYIKKADKNIKTYCSYLLRENEVPLIAAAKEHIKIDRKTILEDYKSVYNEFDCFLTLGTDGIATPVGNNFLEIDVVKTLELPVLFVISPYMNINDILVMINHAVVQKVKISGVVVYNCPYHTDDENIKNLPKLIEKYTDTRVVGVFPEIENIYKLTPGDLISYVLSGVNLERLFDVKIAKLNF